MNAVFKTQVLPAATLRAPNLPDLRLQDAKNRFSKVVRAAKDGVPQWLTVHGKRAAVVLSAEAFEELQREHDTLGSKTEPGLCVNLSNC